MKRREQDAGTSGSQRKKLAALMDLLVKHEPQINYPRHDVRGTHDLITFALDKDEIKPRLAAGGHLMMDCSAAVTCLCKWAGLRDPNGLNYTWEGYTGTLLKNLPHYSDPQRAKVGAIVVFGPGTGEHACMVRKPGKDPLLFSHGQEAGPIYIPLSLERRFHHAPVTFLSIAKLG